MQHSLSDRTAIVASIPMFSGLRKKDVSQLARSADELSYENRQPVVVQGEAGDACYVITDGTAAVYRNGRKVTDLACQVRCSVRCRCSTAASERPRS